MTNPSLFWHTTIDPLYMSTNHRVSHDPRYDPRVPRVIINNTAWLWYETNWKKERNSWNVWNIGVASCGAPGHMPPRLPTSFCHRRSSVNFREQYIFARKYTIYVWKISKMPKFYTILPKISPDFFFGGGRRRGECGCPLLHVSYAYEFCVPPPLGLYFLWDWDSPPPFPPCSKSWRRHWSSWKQR